MARLNAQEAAAKWRTRTAAAGEDYRRGVQRVTVAPGALAAAQKDKYVQRVVESQDKWAGRVGSVSLQEWQQAAAEKGAQRLGTGVAAAESKMAAFMEEAIPYIERLQAHVGQMPTTTFEQRLEKANAWARGMHQFRRSGRR